MKVQANLNRVLTPQKNSTANYRPAFKSAYSPRCYKEVRDLGNAVYRNSKGTQKLLMSLYLNSGETLNNLVTAIGTAGVAPIFIAFNPFSKEDIKSKEYTALRQPISAGITLATQLFVMKNYNKWIDSHAAFLGADEMDLSAKPPASVLRPRVKEEYKSYKAQCIRDGILPQRKSEWIADRIIQLQDEAYYNQLKNLRQNMDISTISMKDIVKPSEVEQMKNVVFKDVLKNKFNFTDEELNLFKNYNDFKSKGKNLIKAKQLDKTLIHDAINSKAEDVAIKELEEAIAMEAKVKFKSSKVLKEMISDFEKGKLQIREKYKLTNDAEANHKAVEAIEKEIQELSKKIYDAKLQKLKVKYDEIVAKSEELKTEAEKITEYAYNKIFKAGSIENIKFHGDTLEDAERSVKIKKWLNTRINKSEAKLKGWKDRSGVLVGLAILPIACGILNWSYPRIMEKFFPNLRAAKKEKANALQEQTDKVKEAK